MHPDDLNAIWQCHECDRVFAFHSDVVEHRNDSGHSDVTSRDLLSKRSNAGVFVRKCFELRFKLDGKISRVSIDCKYYPVTEQISYTDINYSDKKLQSMVEHNSDMVRQIDSYIRRIMQERDSGAKAST